MASAWATAFFVSTVLALAGTPVLRRLALAWRVFDEPEDRKIHASPVPYLGGVAIIAGAVAGLAFGPGLVPKVVAIALGGCAIGCVGLIDDRHALSPSIRLGAQALGAGLAVVVGVRIHATHVAAVDVALTIVWIVGLTNAFNLLDNMDGLAGGIAAVAALGAFAIAALGGQAVIATLAAALAGACLGFLAYNLRPAAIFMGDAGALFLGYTIAITALELDPDLHPPASFVVPLMLLAVPILDTVTVTLARTRRGRPITFGGRDHLSHRLVARGLTQGRAVMVLVAAEAACAVVTIGAGRSVLPLGIALAVVGVVGLGVIGATARVRVYDIPVTGFPVRLWGVMLGIVALAVALALPAAVALLRARTDLRTGANTARDALRAVANGDPARSRSLFGQSQRAFVRAEATLAAAPARVGVAVPVLATNLAAARTLASAGRDLSSVAGSLSATLDPASLQVVAGRVPVNAFDDLAPRLRTARRALAAAVQRTGAVDRTYLAPPIKDALDRFDHRMRRALRSADRAGTATEVMPRLLGAERPRRYFLAVQNNAELRATGGFIGNYGEISANQGQVGLGRFGRISELNGTGSETRVLRAPDDFIRRYGRFEIPHTWQNVNMSPDFPTVTKVIADLYPQSGGQPVDGVIAVDPEGLAALLRLTGPVTVPGWPEPLTAANIVSVSLHDEYERFTDRAVRAQFLGEVANAVWHQVTTTTLPPPSQLARVLGRAARERHLLVAVTDPRDERLLDRLGISGRVPPARSDSLVLVNQNAAGSKVDYFLRRHVDVDVHLEPAEGTPPRLAALRTAVRTTFANDAPDHGLATEAIGPFSPEFTAGENRTFASLYTDHDFTSARIGTERTTLESATELGRRVYSTYVSVPPGTTRTLTVRLAGGVRLGPGGWYALDLVHQPTVNPDRAVVTVTVPPGWRIVDAQGARRASRRRVRARLVLRRDETVWVQVARDGARGFFDRLSHRP